ncbi:hypothetical protein OC835_002390 [Tilletia horrida]|nr:hypothetical protein OC835_002390 [Tilletia horrida]
MDLTDDVEVLRLDTDHTALDFNLDLDLAPLPSPAMAVRSSDILIILIAILFPPAAVGILTGCSCDLLINILLTILGYFPGHIHAFWLIWKKMKAEEEYGYNGFIYKGNGEYVRNPAAPPPVQPPPSYGATA